MRRFLIRVWCERLTVFIYRDGFRFRIANTFTLYDKIHSHPWFNPWKHAPLASVDPEARAITLRGVRDTFGVRSLTDRQVLHLLARFDRRLVRLLAAGRKHKLGMHKPA